MWHKVDDAVRIIPFCRLTDFKCQSCCNVVTFQGTKLLRGLIGYLRPCLSQSQWRANINKGNCFSKIIIDHWLTKLLGGRYPQDKHMRISKQHTENKKSRPPAQQGQKVIFTPLFSKEQKSPRLEWWTASGSKITINKNDMDLDD